MGLAIVSAPSIEPVSLAEAKAHLRNTRSNEDDLIDSLIKASREVAESETNRALISQQWDLTLDCFPAVINLPKSPVITVDSITYIDSDGANQTLATSVYTFDSNPMRPRIVRAYNQVWPVTRTVVNAVTVRITSGYGTDAADVPQAIKQGMLLLIGHWYEHREEISDFQLFPMPRASAALFSTEKVYAI